MHRFGQYLVDPSDFLGWFNELGITAVGVMLFTLFILRSNFLVRLSYSLTPIKFCFGLGIGAVGGIMLTLLLTLTSVLLFQTVLELELADSREDLGFVGPQGTPIKDKLDAENRSKAKQVTLHVASKTKIGGALFAIFCLAMIIGAGYAFTLLKLGFFGTFATMSAGVGLPEELAKAVLGLVVLYNLFDTRSLSRIQFRCAVLAAFAIAGLGFGAGEALKYFGSYAKEDAGWFIYGVRAVWCVTLHGSWTLICGAILATRLPRAPETFWVNKAAIFEICFLASVPTTIAHGLYNACCSQDEGTYLIIVGAVSNLIPMVIIEGFLKGKAEEVLLIEKAKALISAAIEKEMILIRAGKFLMGSPASESGRIVNETQHEVTLTNPFYLGKYEVTQEQWEAVMEGSNPSETQGAKLPVTNVSWEDCQLFIKKLNTITKGGYRLPTEAEWEFACRAGTTTAYSVGESITPGDANYWDTSTEKPVALFAGRSFRMDTSTEKPVAVQSYKPVVVGSYKPNAFGLYDMHGNIWEWCNDWYGNYPTGAVIDPKGPADGTIRVSRGGSFNSKVLRARSSARGFSTQAFRCNDDGFRLARTP